MQRSSGVHARSRPTGSTPGADRLLEQGRTPAAASGPSSGRDVGRPYPAAAPSLGASLLMLAGLYLELARLAVYRWQAEAGA